MAGNILNVAVIFSAIDRMTRPISRMTTGMGKLEQSLYYADRYMSDLFVKGSLGAIAMTSAIYKMVDAYSWVETSIINMSTVLHGNLDLAYDLMDAIRDMAENSPLTAKPLANSANILLSYGVDQSEILSTLKRLGDLAKGNDEVVETLAMGFGRVVAEDRVTREHLDRFIFKGNIPIYEALSQSMGISMEQLREEMQAGRVVGKDLINAINYLTDEGGQFYNAMEKLNMTLQGQTQQFLEKGSRLLGSVGEIIAPFITRALYSVVNPMLEGSRKIVESYLKPTRSEPKLQEDGSYLIEIIDTKTTERIIKKLEELVFSFEFGYGWLDGIFRRLEDGTSLFYDFIDVLIYFIKGVKFVASIIKGMMVVIDVVPGLKTFLSFIIKLTVFLLPLTFVIVKVVGLFGVLKGVFINAFGLISKFIGLLLKIPFTFKILQVKLSKLAFFIGGRFPNLIGQKIALGLLRVGSMLSLLLKSMFVLMIPFIIKGLYQRFNIIKKVIDSILIIFQKLASYIMHFGLLIRELATVFERGNEKMNIAVSYFSNIIAAIIRIFGNLIVWVSNVFNELINLWYVFLNDGFIAAIKQFGKGIIKVWGGFFEWILKGVVDLILSLLPNFVVENVGVLKSMKDWAKSESKFMSEAVKIQQDKPAKEKEQKPEKIVVPAPQVVVNNNITTEAPVSNIETGSKFNYNPNKLANGLQWGV